MDTIDATVALIRRQTELELELLNGADITPLGWLNDARPLLLIGETGVGETSFFTAIFLISKAFRGSHAYGVAGGEDAPKPRIRTIRTESSQRLCFQPTAGRSPAR